MMDNPEVRGTLIPIGGNEDKGQQEYSGNDFIEQGILAQVVAQSGGIKAKIVVIPTASSIPEEVGENYLNAFKLLDCDDVTVLNIQKKHEANSAETLKLIAAADCVMFSGGDQSRISRIIGGTKMHELLAKRYISDDFVIAGTSAGAMAMSTEMVAGGSSQESLLVGAVRMKKGLGLLPSFIIDTHFVKRGRFGRLTEAVASFPDLMGVGLAEDTGLIIKNATHFRVIGSGMVILFDPSKLTHNKHAVLAKGTPMSLSNLITHVLARGDQFMFADRKIEIFTSAKTHVGSDYL